MKIKPIFKIVFSICCFFAAAKVCADALPSGDSLSELYLERAGIFAKYGEIFADSGLRDYFLINDKNYESKMLERWREEVSADAKAAKEGVFTKTALNGADASLVKAADEKIERFRKNNFIEKN
jgi:hypothetical protein